MQAPTPSRDLVHPLFLGAVGVLLLNDHVLKGSGLLPGWFTGKLSDFAGLYFFPVLAFAVLDWVTRGRACTHRSVLGGALAAVTALGFALVKLSPGMNEWVGAFWGPMVLDATDLVALPSALASWVFLVHAENGAKARARFAPTSSRAAPTPEAVPWTLRALRFGAMALAGVASIATPAPQRVRNYPFWRIETPGPRAIGCAEVDAWVSKSGKEGFGVTMILDSLSEPCSFQLRRARFLADGVKHDASTLPPPVTLVGRARTYVPFEFDNEALWNDGVRDGKLELVLAADGAAEELVVLALHHEYDGPHARRAEPPP
jgi:hypothetical protein